MEQAIMIMAHKNRAQLEKLITYFDGKCDIIIHLDKGSDFTREDEVYLSRLSGVRHVSRKIAVHWGGYSLLRCQLHLLEQALRHSDCRYVHMLSGQDYPLRPLDDFLHFFGLSDKEFIEGAHLPAPHWDGNTYKRIQHYYFTDWFRLSSDVEIQKVWDFADKQDRWGIRRRIPDQVKHLYGGSAWFSLTRACAEAVIGYSRKHPSLLRRFRYTFAPDELYIQTVARHVDFPGKQFGGGNLRFIHWLKSGANHPACLDEAFFHEISSSGAFFARKYEQPECAKLQEWTDKYLVCPEKRVCTKTGAWLTRTFTGHFFDSGLSKGIAKLCKVCKVKNVIDLGCGPGWYVTALRKEKVAAVGYDGNPNTGEFSRLLAEQKDFPCGQADLVEELIAEEPFDVTLCLSVGEYIPSQYEEQVWKNLSVVTKRFLVISWASPDIYEEGVVNAHATKEIIKTANSFNFKIDELATVMLREYCWTERHKKNIIVFTK